MNSTAVTRHPATTTPDERLEFLSRAAASYHNLHYDGYATLGLGPKLAELLRSVTESGFDDYYQQWLAAVTQVSCWAVGELDGDYLIGRRGDSLSLGSATFLEQQAIVPSWILLAAAHGGATSVARRVYGDFFSGGVAMPQAAIFSREVAALGPDLKGAIWAAAGGHHFEVFEWLLQQLPIVDGNDSQRLQWLLMVSTDDYLTVAEWSRCVEDAATAEAAAAQTLNSAASARYVVSQYYLGVHQPGGQAARPQHEATIKYQAARADAAARAADDEATLLMDRRDQLGERVDEIMNSVASATQSDQQNAGSDALEAAYQRGLSTPGGLARDLELFLGSGNIQKPFPHMWAEWVAHNQFGSDHILAFADLFRRRLGRPAVTRPRVYLSPAGDWTTIERRTVQEVVHPKLNTSWTLCVAERFCGAIALDEYPAHKELALAVFEAAVSSNDTELLGSIMEVPGLGDQPTPGDRSFGTERQIDRRFPIDWLHLLRVAVQYRADSAARWVFTRANSRREVWVRRYENLPEAPVTLAAVRELVLRSGELRESDLQWLQGALEWR